MLRVKKEVILINKTTNLSINLLARRWKVKGKFELALGIILLAGGISQGSQISIILGAILIVMWLAKNKKK